MTLKPDDELELRDRVDALTNNAVEQMVREHELRTYLHALVENLDDEDRRKVFDVLTDYTYDKLVMHQHLPHYCRISLAKTQDYFAHQCRIANWVSRREALEEEWLSMDDELDDINAADVDLLELEDIPEFETKKTS